MKLPQKYALAAGVFLLLSLCLFFLQTTERQPSEITATESLSTAEIPQAIARAERELIAALQEPANDPSTLLELAAERRNLMLRLIAENPQSALEHAYSYADYHNLPPQIQALSERPFTETANYTVLAICDENPATPEHQHSLRFPDGTRAQISRTAATRLSLTKENAPLQGIVLDGLAVVRPQVFQTLDSADADWARQTLPLANASAGADFFTDQPIVGTPTLAVAGGFLFQFSSLESLNEFEEKLATFDARPGLALGSPALLASLHREPAAFSTSAFFAEQEIAAAPPTNEIRDYLVIRIDFSDKTGTPFSQEQLESLVDNTVAPALANYSYNKTTVAITATSSVYRLGNSSNYTDTDDIYDDAVAAYIADGNANPNIQYEHVSISFPKLDFPWAGLATVGGRAQWLQGSVRASTILHELGHNYGLSHASYWQHDGTNQASTDPVDPTGATISYGDIFDTMGDGNVSQGHFHVAAKQYLGWITPDQWSSLDLSEDSGTYRIYQFDTPSATGLQALRIAKSESSDYYWLGYRKKYPGVSHFEKGAYLVWENRDPPLEENGDPPSPNNNNRCWLIDTTVNSPDGKADAGIALGRTYSDTDSQIHITPIATGQNSTGSYLDVSVNIGSFAGNQAPTGTLTASPTGEARSPVSFSFSGSDPDGDELSYNWDFGDGTVEINAASVDHSFPVGGSYTLTLTVSDKKGGVYTEQSNVEISDPINQLTTRTSNTTNDLHALAVNDSQIIAAGSRGTFLSSEDGISWTNNGLGLAAINVTIFDVLWTGSEFVAVGVDFDEDLKIWLGVVYTSSDGTTWTPIIRTTETVGSWGFNSVAYDPITTTLVVAQSDAKMLVRDPNDDWFTVDLGLSANAWSNSSSVVWTGSVFIAGGYDFSQPGAENRLVIRSSSDGLSWQDKVPDSGIPNWKGLNALAFLNEKLMGSGYKSGIAYSLNLGDAWTTNQQGTVYRADSFAFGNGIYSAHGVIDNAPDQIDGSEDTSQDFLSVDGRNWKPAGDPGTAYNDRIFFANTFISVGDFGLIDQSAPFEAVAESSFQAWIVGFISEQAEQGALANPDRDWAPNFLEFALGSNPLDADSVPSAPTLGYTPDGRIAVSIPRFSATDVSLSLEVSTDLETWTPIVATATVDTDLLLELTSTAVYSDSQTLFIRIKAAQ